MVLGVALSGGGARGDFEVGALRYLYDRGRRPEVIAGTSVGAINGAKLAEGGDFISEGFAGHVHKSQVSGTTPLYRLWSPGGLDHFYTTSSTERDTVLAQNGYLDEGVACRVFADPKPGTVPLLRLWNPTSSDHFYTTSEAERDLAVAQSGYRYEFAACHVYPSPTAESVPLYRLWNERAGDHLYTTSADERDAISDSLGALNGLEAIWSQLRSNADMYKPQPWLTKVTDSRVLTFFDEGAVGRIAMVPLRTLIFPPLGLFDLITAGIDIGILIDALTKAADSPSLYTLAPILAKLRDSRNLLPTKVSSSGIRLRLVMVGLESGLLRYVTEKGEFYGAATTTRTVDLVDAILASASIPGVFPPVAIGDEMCVDGGVREILPIAAAIEAGANEVIAIGASPRVGRAEPFARPSIFRVGTRALDIITDEVDHNDSSPRQGWEVPVIVIEPRVDVHDTMTIDPGLIRISMDYGYMRAADEIAAPGIELSAKGLADRITKLRRDIWRIEHEANGQLLARRVRGAEIQPVPSPEGLKAVRRLKHELYATTVMRLEANGVLPARPELWWTQWEGHNWRPRIPTPWDRFAWRLGAVDAEEPPPPLPVPAVEFRLPSEDGSFLER